jgi:hypothetical protein
MAISSWMCKPKQLSDTDRVSLFRLLSAEHTGIDFVNQLDYTEELNTYTYKNFYSGGGVALGDMNNDGLIDIFLAGNLVTNKLFLNKGNLQFEDVSVASGLAAEGIWTTGASIADINSDGWLDIYLCKSGPPGGERRHNELFINNGDLTFTEAAAAYGLDFEGLSTQAAFFDYDRDGDLDCYLLNNSFRSVGGYDLRVGQRNKPDPLGGNRLMRNDDGKFTDVSEMAGIYTSEIGFGLGVTIGDINKDGWQDIYVSNDFFEKDYLYINNKDGSFSESLEMYMQEISLGSMGADLADINNDGQPEIFVTEMLPASEARRKTTAQFESWDKYDLNVKNGYYKQFGRNVLQLNNGNNTFSEISRLSGVDATDWSWAALIFDMNNDGHKDIFVANGIYKDLLNQDYVNFSSSPELLRQIQQRKKGVILQLIDSMPSTPLPNYSFENLGNLQFVNRSNDWGLDMPTFSNGSAYGDLDNDGDLDLVLNNVNMPAQVYENRSSELLPQNKSLSFMLHGEGKNTFGLGAKITLTIDNTKLYQELAPMRGFMSTVDHRMVFGLGNNDVVDTVIVEWPNESTTILTSVTAGQLLHVYQKDAQPNPQPGDGGLTKTIFNERHLSGVAFVHVENEYVDFDKDHLLFNMNSNEGPCLCKGDIDGDGRDDFYVGGSKNQAGELYVQKKPGVFEKTNQEVFAPDKGSEDVGCIFFDANNDGRPDIYVASGGVEFNSSSISLLDRLYLNTGTGAGRLLKSKQLLPVEDRLESTKAVAAYDFDQDGDQDLFVGTRLTPDLYGLPGNGYLLRNDGMGNFNNVTSEVAPDLLRLGMTTAARWLDVNNDGSIDLLVVGDWMPIRLFIMEGGRFVDRSVEYGLGNTNGWYRALETGDFNGDGWIDFVVGNHGLNSRFKTSIDEPVTMYINDFDQNGTVEQITTQYESGKPYPVVLRTDLITQIPSLKKKYLHFKDYKEKAMWDIFAPEQLANSLVLNAHTFETVVWLNNGNGTFSRQSLPIEAQFFPVYAIAVNDFTRDGEIDIMLGGNQFRAKPETGIYAGGYGQLLRGNGAGRFETVPGSKSGLVVRGEVRSFGLLTDNNRKWIVVGKNNDRVSVLEY